MVVVNLFWIIKVFYYKKFFLFYFKDDPNVNILAWYCDANKVNEKIAIVECKVKNGKAILCGIHPEVSPSLLDSTNPYIKKILPNLLSRFKNLICLFIIYLISNLKRLELFRMILKKFNLELTDNPGNYIN